jgi:hypothetical protein
MRKAASSSVVTLAHVKDFIQLQLASDMPFQPFSPVSPPEGFSFVFSQNAAVHAASGVN